MIGTTLGPYTILTKIGEGGMGEVYRARDTRLARDVAVKILPAVGARDDAAIERFRREARAASSLNHPHVCAVHDFGEHDGRPFLVMELLDGMSLQDALKSGPLTPVRVLEIAIDVVDGLDAAHEKGIVHRDLKPANLFITSRGRAKVLDFGVAKHMHTADDAATVAGLTDAGEAVGTIAYMSPEQARGEAVDARTDLFSFGLVLYEMLAGRPAIAGPTTAVLFDALLNKQPAPLCDINRAVPKDLESVVTRLLVKQPAGRYQTAKALLEDLQATRRALESGPVPRAAAVAPSTQSVAVLPFASLSADPENEYLADGITEEVINALGRIRTLHVPGRVSCFAFKGKSVDIADVAAKLNVSNVLTGSVRRAGNRLRITAELVSAANGFQLWSERFDRTADDVFAIQDEIASNIAARLQTTFPGAAGEPLVRRPTESLDAYNAYLKGRFLLNQRGQGIRNGLEAFKHALSLDPNFALAHAGAAEAYSLTGFYGYLPERQVMPLAEAAAERALALEPELAEPHAALLIVHFTYHWNWEAAREEFDRAMRKNPRTVSALTMRAIEVSAAHGRIDEACALAERAIAVDPLSPFSFSALAVALMCGRRWTESMAAIERSLDLLPGWWIAERLKAVVLSMQGQHEEALQAIDRAIAASNRHPWTLGNKTDILTMAGRPAEARAVAEELLAAGRERYVQPSGLGIAAFLVHGSDEAFAWFERACQDHDFLPVVNYFPSLFGVKRDPRWPALMRRIGLEPAPIFE